MDSKPRSDQPSRPSLSDEVFGEGTAHPGRFGFRSRQLPPGEVQLASEQLQRRLRQSQRRRWQLSAAAVVLLLIGTLTYRPLYEALTTVRYATGYGETQQIDLPDGSTVILNANSRLHYPKPWPEERPREIWLRGEAYFSVKKTGNPGNQRFVVHTDGLAIEVVGTTFNVNQREQATQVVLTSGKVKLFRNGAARADAVMQPGDLVVYSPQTQRLTQRATETQLHTAWKENLLVFKDQSLQDIGRTLNDRYGITLRFGSPDIAQQRFTTTLPADRIEVFFTMLSSSYTIQRISKTVTVHEKKP
ncbi:MAG: FecR domain-containing protein [Tunicatimonas sp.]